MKMNTRPLSWYEDNATEIKHNPDGSVTFVFDEAYTNPSTGLIATSSTTISEESYQKAKADPKFEV